MSFTSEVESLFHHFALAIGLEHAHPDPEGYAASVVSRAKALAEDAKTDAEKVADPVVAEVKEVVDPAPVAPVVPTPEAKE
jgi:hypothetical protein